MTAPGHALDDWYLQNLICPHDQSNLREGHHQLVCERGHQYAIVSGVPVMLVEEASPTLHVVSGSIAASKANARDTQDALFLETLGVDEDQRIAISEQSKNPGNNVDPVVNYLVAHTSGLMYQHLVGRLSEYPIPDIPLPFGNGASLLDIGCSWGRWCISAGRKGYQAVGIDPSLGAVLAARRVASQLGVDGKFLVADARHLPFRQGSFDVVYSYSVIQHFGFDDVRRAMQEACRVLAARGLCQIQLANACGFRSLCHQVRRGFRDARGFEVRYLQPQVMRKLVQQSLTAVELKADCYFGLGLQKGDLRFMPQWKRFLTMTSELLKRIANNIPPMSLVADSVFVVGRKA
ncbi:MAG: methyltransferase domain-containing protein [Verrucomicrobia subdivision 3 bacterium]|nr:methyltransferase domain-containing protein [Limisphaerales bacterium]